MAGTDLQDYEPHLNPSLAAGAFYPQDAQVQPMLLVAQLLRLARELGATVQTQNPVTGLLRDGDRVTGVETTAGPIAAGAVVNAAGPWAGSVAELAGVELPVLPRRGFVLVTQPLPRTVHHKVYAGEYVANVLSSDAGLQTSPVVEGTPSGTVLIGSSRERVGFDRSVSLPVLAVLARQAVALFPMLRNAKAMRSYLGFRPYCPDHLPVIGEDPRAPGLWHAAGHEGAGIGLSVGTAKLLAQAHRRRAHRPGPDAVPPRALRVRPCLSAVDDRPERRVTITYDGQPLAAAAGDSVGAALTRAGVRSWRTTRHGGRPRGLFCGIGICYDCLLTIDGAPDQRACLAPAADGMDVRSGGAEADD